MLIMKVASWALAVRVSSSIGASSKRAEISRPANSDASVATSQEGWSTQARPIPERCDPCPGKVKANTYGLLSGVFEPFDHNGTTSLTCRGQLPPPAPVTTESLPRSRQRSLGPPQH